MSILRVRTTVSGFAGGPGLMTQYFSSAVAPHSDAIAQLAVDRVKDSLTAGSAMFHQSLSFAVGGDVDELDETTGQLVESYGVTGRTVTGTSFGSGIGPSPAGACVVWRTGQFKAGRRVMGRTFLVPLSSESFETNGTLSTTALQSAQAYADAMQDAGATDLVFVVWARPRLGVGGSKHGVTAATIKDKVAVLRSRRD